jgi:hypothetical protein
MDERFNSRTVDLGNLVEPIDKRIHGHGTVERALIPVECHLLQLVWHQPLGIKRRLYGGEMPYQPQQAEQPEREP